MRNIKSNIHFFLFIVFAGIIISIFIPHIQHHFVQFVDKSLIVSCKKSLKTIRITIGKTGFVPQKTYAKVCETIDFYNTDSVFHLVAFGNHPYNLAYPKFIERLIAPKKTNSVLLTAYGIYKIHDHLYESISGELDISK